MNDEIKLRGVITELKKRQPVLGQARDIATGDVAEEYRGPIETKATLRYVMDGIPTVEQLDILVPASWDCGDRAEITIRRVK